MVEGYPGKDKDYSKWKAGASRAIARLKPIGEVVERRLGLDTDSGWEKAGAKLSTKFGSAFTRVVERRVRKFDIEIQNSVNLEALRGQPHIIVANHPTPRDNISQKSGISPDAPIVAYVVREATGETVHFFGHYGEEAAPFIKEWPEKWVAKALEKNT
jgi:hypothetical protein